MVKCQIHRNIGQVNNRLHILGRASSKTHTTPTSSMIHTDPISSITTKDLTTQGIRTNLKDHILIKTIHILITKALLTIREIWAMIITGMAITILCKMGDISVQHMLVSQCQFNLDNHMIKVKAFQGMII